MATYRQVHVSFWHDSFVIELTPEEKYFYLYLLTNPHTTQIGIYELPLRLIETETGYNRETVEKLIQRFEDYGKIKYSRETKEIVIINWLKYNYIDSSKVKVRMEKDLEEVKDKKLIPYAYGIDRLSEEREREREEEKEKKENNNNKKNKKKKDNNSSDTLSSIEYQSIIDYYHATCPTLPKVMKLTKSRKEHLNARIQEFGLEKVKLAIDKTQASDFLTNRKSIHNKRKPGHENWQADFDFIINPNKFVNIIEGKYDNGDTPNTTRYLNLDDVEVGI